MPLYVLIDATVLALLAPVLIRFRILSPVPLHPAFPAARPSFFDGVLEKLSNFSIDI